MIYQIVFNCGYVESGQNSYMIFHLKNSALATKMEAVQDLAHQLFGAYFEDKNYGISKTRKCCAESIAQDASFAYCPQCGSSLRPRFDFADFSEWVTSLHGSVVDGTGTMEDHGDWWMWPTWEDVLSVPMESTVVLRENAEHIFTQALSPTFLASFNERGVPVDEHWKYWYMANMAHDENNYQSKWPDNPSMDYVVAHQEAHLRKELDRSYQ